MGRRATLTLVVGLVACQAASDPATRSTDAATDAGPYGDAALSALDAAALDAATVPGDATLAPVDAVPSVPDVGVPVDLDVGPAPDLGMPLVDAAPTSPDASAPPVVWPRGETELPTMPGGPRQELGVLRVGAELHVLGGVDADERPLARHEVFDTLRGEWRAAPDLPVPVNHPNAAVDPDGRIWILGFLGRRAVPDRRSYVYAPATGVWTDAPPLPPGRVRGDAATVTRGRELLLIGGSAVRGVALCDAFDMDTGVYRTLPDLPEPRDHAAAAVIDGAVYVAAGTEGSPDALLPTAWRLDEAGGRWEVVAPLPTPRGAAGYAVLDGRLVLLGGEGEGPDAVAGAYADVDVYDPALGAWTALAPLRAPRRAFGAVALGEVLYLVGGADRIGLAPLDRLTVWRP